MLTYNATPLNATPPNGPPPRASISDHPIYDVGLVVNNVYLWIIFALGFPGNVFAFVTIATAKPRLRFTLYVAALACTDNTCLVCKLAFISLTRRNVNLGDAGCCALQYLGAFTGQLANWLLVLMTAERLYWVINSVVVISLLLFNVHYFFTYQNLEDDAGRWLCGSRPKLADAVDVLEWVNVAVYALVPVAVLAAMNGFIVRALYKASKTARRLSSSTAVALRRERSQRDATLTLVVTCVVFTLLVTPRPVLSAVISDWPPDPGTSSEANIAFLGQVFYVLSDSSHAINFYLYFVSNQHFRRRFARLVKRFLFRLGCCVRLRNGVTTRIRERVHLGSMSVSQGTVGSTWVPTAANTDTFSSAGGDTTVQLSGFNMQARQQSKL